MKKILAIITVTALIFGFTACKDNKKVQVDGQYVITWLGNPNMPMEKDTEAQKFIEEKFDVKIEPISITTSYIEKIGGMIASNDTPDIMFINEPEHWQPLAEQLALAEIPVERIQKYAPNYYKWVTEMVPDIFAISNIDGVNWAIPKISGGEYNTSVIWRKDWLDKLGITKVPDTLSEFEEAFIKIRNEDPDGNGQKDTYGLTGLGGHPVRQFDMIFGAYGIMPAQWVVEDGKVINGTIHEKSRTALELLKKWYEMELIDPEFITDNVSTHGKKFESGRLAIVTDAAASWIPSMPVGKMKLDDWKAREADAEFVIGSIPQGPDGKRGDWLWGPRGNFVVFGEQLEKDPEKLNYILKMLDTMFSDEETALRLTWGRKGIEYDYNDPEIGESSGLKYLPPYDNDIAARAKAGVGQFGFYNQLTPLVGFSTTEISRKYSPKEYLEINDRLSNWSNCQDALLRPGLPSGSEYVGNLEKVKTTAYSAFITGTRDLAEWDAFVQEWESQGGRQLTLEAQEFYNSNFR